MDQETLQTVDRDIGLFVAIVREMFFQGLVDELCEERITVGQVRCMCFIWSHEGVTIGDVARGLGISYPAATKTVSRLVEKGFVKRIHNQTDRRNIFVEITPLGIELTAKIKPEKLRRLRSLLDRLAPEDLGHLRKGLEAFLSVSVTDEELFAQICLHCGREHVENCILLSSKCRKYTKSQ